MKKFMKFIPVALGMLMLASCSSDDFFGDSQKADFYANLGEGDMVVSVGDPVWVGKSITRGLRDFDPVNKKFPYVFVENDNLRVYDKYLLAFDKYTFMPEDYGTPAEGEKPKYKFQRTNGESNIGEPMFALYPSEDVIRGNWDYVRPNEYTTDPNYVEGKNNHTHGWVKVDIAPYMSYEAGYSAIYDRECKTPLYKDRIPMFGMVESVDEGYVKADMEYLTGVLCWEATAKGVEGMKVVVVDHETQQPLTIAGRFQTDLIENNIPKLKYTGTGDDKEVVESETARITVDDLLPEEEYSRYDGDFDCNPAQAIIVDIKNGNNNLKNGNENHLKVFVPLVCSDKLVDIIVYQTADLKQKEDGTDDSEWVQTWRQNSTTIERGRFYWNQGEYNSSIDGVTICAISDALALETEKAVKAGLPEGSLITVTAKNPIEISETCNTLLIPNKKYQFVIDLKNGVYGATTGEVLNVKYASEDTSVEGYDPATVPTAEAVKLIAKRDATRSTNSGNHIFGLNVELAKTVFDLVNIRLTDAEMTATGFNTALPISAPSRGDQQLNLCKIDAKSFIFGGEVYNENEEEIEVESMLDGTIMQLSDNVESIIVRKNGTIDYLHDGYYSDIKYGLIIPDGDAPAGYQNKKISAITIHGAFLGGIDAHADNALDVDLTVGPEKDKDGKYNANDNYAVLASGDYRVKGKIDVLEKGLIWAYLGNPTRTPYIGVAAAQKGVNVTGKSFISGAVFTKAQNITINNKDFNVNSLINGGGELSALIYELYTNDEAAQIVAFLQQFGYGPLYAETGSVDITSDNSTLTINSRVNNEVWNRLNEHAAWAVQFTVFANKDIDLKTESNGTITTQSGTNMWAENDIHFNGNGGNILSRGRAVADHNYAMTGKSRANFVQCGHNATITVDEQNGNCEAVETLVFYPSNDAENPGNALYLNEGYIGSVINANVVWASVDGSLTPTLGEPLPVNLYHGSKAGYTAIREVAYPDALTAMNASIWNGKQMPAAMKTKYVTVSNPLKPDLWTASELAAQTTGVTTNSAQLRSDIDLVAANEWPGITTNKGEWANYTFDGMGHTISNATLVAKDDKTAGFINYAYGTVGVSNLTLDNVTTKIAPTNSEQVSWGTGAVVGRAEKYATLSRVKVKLGNGNFGSDGTDNVKSANIGGAIGAALGGASLWGVQVDAKLATVAGYHSLGGFIGKAKGNVVIEKSPASAAGPKMNPSVTDLKIQVTYVTNAADETVNDLNQMKHGLYIGSVEFTTAGAVAAQYYESAYEYNEGHNLEGDARITNDQFAALSQEDKLKTEAIAGTPTTVTISDAQPATTAYTVNAELDGCDLKKKVFYHLQRTGEEYMYTYKFEDGEQDLIGFCGKEVVNPKAIMINGESFYIYIQGNSGMYNDAEKKLYSLTRKKTN